MGQPLFGFEWNQIDLPRDVEEAIFTIVAKDRLGGLHAVGTGFIVKAFSDTALAISAAHVFDEIPRLQQLGIQRSHRSTLPEFAPEPKQMLLALEGLAMIALKETRPVVMSVDGVAFDRDKEIGVAQLRPQKGHESEFPLREFRLDDATPSPGQLVCVASYANLSYRSGANGGIEFGRRAVLRIGRVLNVFPEGQRLCRGSCFETSIPMYSGMSGGPVFLYDTDGPMRAIGVVCSDPDPDGAAKDDRSIAGRSLVSCLPVVRTNGDPLGIQEVQISLTVSVAAGTFGNDIISALGSH